MNISQSQLKELLSYDPKTGLFTWLKGRHRGKRAGVVDQTLGGYVRIKIGPKKYLAHRLVWLFVHGVMPAPGRIDHRDTDRANNRIANLREATPSQQRMNSKTRADNRSGLKGVGARRDRSSFAAIISIGGKQKTLGYFKSPEAAHAAYAGAAEIHFGGYRRLS